MSKNFSLDAEQEYCDELIAAGLDPAIAKQIAAKTMANRRELAEKSRVERKAEKASIVPAEEIDYRNNKAVPKWVREVIEAHLAIETENAKTAGELGYLSRALVIATMPYREQKRPDGSTAKEFSRVNGDFRLEILSSHGIPFGIYPRLLMSWVTTEAVRRQSPIIELGDSLRIFLREVLDIKSTSGGSRGSGARVLEQMKRLFGALITAQYTGTKGSRGFALRNILIATDLQLSQDEIKAIEALDQQPAPGKQLWTPQSDHEAGTWQSKLVLSDPFFKECITSPVPIDLRAYKALRGSPLAMDVYSWMTYRMSYVHSQTKPIPWEALMLQFGSGFSSKSAADPTQAVRNFKKDFLKALKLVQIVYPQANFTVQDNGLVLRPSPTHIPKIYTSSSSSETPKLPSGKQQGSLF